MNEKTEENNALRKENMQLKAALQKNQTHYQQKALEYKRLLIQCSVGLRQAAAQIERQNQIISHLKQQRDAKPTQVDLPDSTT